MSPAVAHRAAVAAHDAAIARGASRGEATRAFWTAREAAHGHRDAQERAALVGQIVMAGFARGVPQDGHEAACGLSEGSLSDGTVLTAGLRAALARMRGAPR